MNSPNLLRRPAARQSQGRLPSPALSTLIACALASASSAQSLIDDGNQYPVSYDSANVAQDFTIPASTSAQFLKLSARGAEGGSAEAGGCLVQGGSPASGLGTFRIGTGSKQLKPGGTVRFIVGEAGEDGKVGANARRAGGGGGGSAVLYQAPSGSSWTILLASGAGGGAYSGNAFGFCVDSEPGGDAKTGTSGGGGSGSGGGSGGVNGGQGQDSTGLSAGSSLSGGGGGAFSGANNGDLGGGKGKPNGGSGGSADEDGGWGFGGGGAAITGGGGGGGYSGGGGGGLANEGGGGGSYANPNWAIESQIFVSSVNGDGLAFYQLLDQLGATTCAAATPIADGSYTVDTFSQTVPGFVTNCLGLPQQAKVAWFSYTNPGVNSIVVTATTCNTNTTLARVNVSVMSSCGDASAPDVACGQVACGTGSEKYDAVTWTMAPFETHLIRVITGGPPGIQGYPFQLDVSSVVQPVSNDTCATAMSLGEGSFVASMTGATPDAAGIQCGPLASWDDVWFAFDNTSTSCAYVEVTAALTGVDFLGLDAWSGNCGNLTLVNCSGSSVGSNTLSFTVPVGGTIRYRVTHGTVGPLASFTLDVTSSDSAGTFDDLGNSLAPAGGTAPVLTGDGVLCPGGAVTISLSGAPAGALTWLAIGFSELNLPLLGGVLVPSPDIIASLPADAAGAVDLPLLWSAGLDSAAPITMQFWVLDLAGPSSFSASNGLRLNSQ